MNVHMDSTGQIKGKVGEIQGIYPRGKGKY